MKINFTKSLMTFIAVAFSLALTAQNPITYIWGGPNATDTTEYNNSTFNGGLNDWVTEGVSVTGGGSPDSALWRWDENGAMAGGAYWGANSKIQSPSVANGAVGFDSDYFDNAGIPNNFGKGVAPSPQVSTLTSPSMDCTGESDVTVIFYESYRNYKTSTYIDVSNDGGNTWVQYNIIENDGIDLNNSTGGDAWTYVVITPTAANQADVRIRFRFDGEYYFWIVDDVALIQTPTNDLAVVDYFYPAGSYAQPSMTGVGCDSMGFNCTLRNVPKQTRTNVTAYVNVSDANGVIYTDSVELDEFTGVEDSVVVFNQLWSPGNVPGDYVITYSVSDGTEDFNPGDNSNGRGYIISTKDFAKGPGIASYPFPLAKINSFFAVGSFYRTCDFDYSADGLEVAIDSFGFAVRNFELTELTGATVEGWIKKVIVDSLKYPEVKMSASMNENDNIGWEQKGYAEFTFTSEDQDKTIVWITQFTDLLTGDLDVILDPNAEYLALVETSGNTGSVGVGIGYSPNMHYSSGGGIILQDGDVFGGWNESTAEPQVILKLKFLVNSTQPRLADNVITVMPNPVQNQLNLKLDFNKPTAVAYALGTVTGSILQAGNWENAMNETHTLDVSNLANGQYLVRIQTADGIATKMFVVAR